VLDSPSIPFFVGVRLESGAATDEHCVWSARFHMCRPWPVPSRDDMLQGSCNRALELVTF